MPRKTSIVVALLIVFCMLCLAVTNWLYEMVSDHTAVGRDARLAVTSQVPDFTLTNSYGRAFGLSNLVGKIWVADFVFTTCPTTCPIMMNGTAKLQRALPVSSDLSYVSISVNPSVDTPAVLAKYAREYRANRKNWHFLTGPMADIVALSVDGLKIAKPDEPIGHSTYFVLVDRECNIRGYYDGMDEAVMGKLKEDIRFLLESPDA